MENIALQLWTVREQYDSDPARVLHRVAENGYPAIELVYGRTGGLTPAHQKEICDDVGLRVPAVHCFFNEIEDQLDGLIEAGKELGVEHVVCSWMDPGIGSVRPATSQRPKCWPPPGPACATKGCSSPTITTTSS